MKHYLLILAILCSINLASAQTSLTAAKSIGSFKTTESPELIFKLGNGMSRLPAIAIKNLTEASIGMSDNSKTDYTLEKFTIRVLYTNTQTFKTSINIGSSLSEETKAILSQLKPGDILVVTGISAKNSNGEPVYIRDRNFAAY